MNGRGHQPFERVERWLDGHYARVGIRYLLEVQAGALVWVMFIFLLGVGGLILYLDGSTGDFLHLLAVAEAMTVVFGPPGLWLWARRAPAMTGWMRGERSPETAPAAWKDTIAAPVRMPLTVYSVAVPAQVVFAFYAAPVLDKGPATVPVILVAAAMLTVIGALGVAVFLGQLAVRPILRQITTYLPEHHGFERSRYGLAGQLIVRLAVLGLIMLFAGGVVSVLSEDPDTRFALSFTVGPAVLLAFGLLTFPLTALSLVSPVNALIDATRRVRDGDLTAQVPIVTSDELGELSHTFNRMTADLRRTTEELQESRARIVAASDAARRRVERDLHDGAQQDLVLLNLKLGLLARNLRNDPDAAEALIDELRGDLDRGLAQLRDLAHGIYPAVIESDGLPAALRDAAGRAAIATTVDCDGTGRFDREIEAAVYFCCLEALQNASKHAGESASATVRCRTAGGTLHFEVSDDGPGFTVNGTPTGGLQNMADRVGALGGELVIDSAPGRGTTVRGSVPVG